jgi:transcriptional regulator NrdR family protein
MFHNGRVGLMTCRERRKLIEELVLVGVKRELTPAELKTALSGISARLRMLHSDVLREDIPDRMAELLRQLDESTQG